MLRKSPPTIQVLTGHGESVTPTEPRFEWFFRCLSIMPCEVMPSHGFCPTSPPAMLFVGDPQGIRFTDNEIGEIQRFVAEGGSLLVLGRYGGDKRQDTNLSDLTPGLRWENSLVKSNELTTYQVRIQNGLEAKEWIDSWSSDARLPWGMRVDCPCGLASSKDGEAWHTLLRAADPTCLSAPSYDHGSKSYLGTPSPQMSNIVATYRTFEHGRIVAISSRYMFSNALMGANTSFLAGVLRWLLGGKHAHGPVEDHGPCRTDATQRLRKLANQPESVFCLLAATGFFQAVLPDRKLDNVDLSVPWAEPVWIQDTLPKCLARMRDHPRVRHNYRERVEFILNQYKPLEILTIMRQFPLNSDNLGEILTVTGLCEAFRRVQREVELAVLDET